MAQCSYPTKAGAVHAVKCVTLIQLNVVVRWLLLTSNVTAR
jgi:hypothetical protein